MEWKGNNLKREEEGFSVRDGDKANNITKRRIMEEKEKGRRKNTKVQKKKGEKSVKILSWNIAGLKNKNEDFWKYIEQIDIVGF